MPENHEAFANPPPPNMEGLEKSDVMDSHPLTNDDFRKLMMTPRAPSSSQNTSQSTVKSEAPRPEPVSSRLENRKQKKTYYAQLKKQEESMMAELAKKYRDRAKERRDGKVEDQPSEMDSLGATAGYKAVAPDLKSGYDAAERRRQMIQNSKFLGGDMEHTHLVKGLDYALLQKVRSEITNKESEDVELEEALNSTKNKDEEDEEEQIQFKTRFAKNIYRQMFKNKFPERNENFLPGRMAYIIELDDDYTESDIPTTLMRSKTDCPNMESQTTLTTNDIVINKLTQILSYLRSGIRNNKRIKKKDKGKTREDDEKIQKMADENIYEGIGDYDPSITNSRKHDHHSKDRSKDKRRSYFGKSKDYDDSSYRKSDDSSHRKSSRSHESRYTSSDSKHSDSRNHRPNSSSEPVKTTGSKKTKGMNLGGDSYAECYPGAPETADAVEDSDDEVDYSKMDMGNKKGPIGRWDFDTQEEYSDYMSNKEALPKAAFQYGVKMADGRKTRRATTGKKDEKAELDREWQKISQIISKRKTDTDSSTSSSYKRSKY